MHKHFRKLPARLVTTTELSQTLAGPLLDWRVVGTSLERNVTFKSFKTTWEFLSKVATYSHAWCHHPTITTTFRSVKLQLCTHDLGNRISDIDLQMAQKFEDLITATKSKASNPK